MAASADALNRVWAALEPLNLPMALMGGLAVAVWKHPRNTRDEDVLVDVRDGNLDELVEAMQRAGMVHTPETAIRCNRTQPTAALTSQRVSGPDR